MSKALKDMQMCCGTTCNKADNIEYLKHLESLLIAVIPYAVEAAKSGLDAGGVVEGSLLEFAQKFCPDYLD